MNDAIHLEKIYRDAFRFFKIEDNSIEINVEFYPYIGIHHTIRVRNGKVFVRIAEICRSAPTDFHKALAMILVGKLRRKKTPPEYEKIYREFIKRPEIQIKSAINKREKGRKRLTSAKGEVYDLEEIFQRMNATYFENSIEKPILSWSQKKTYRILGHHDSAHQTIIVSKSLDSAKVPAFVVDFVVFHEMLHIFHPTIHRNDRRFNHTPQFRRDERKFVYFSEAENWIEENASKLKRRVKNERKNKLSR